MIKLPNAVFSVLFNYLLYTYITRLEDISCNCGLTSHRLSIKSSIIINYLLLFGFLIFDEVPLITKIMIFIYNYASSINIFLYLYKLKNEKCKCSDSLIRDIYYYYYYLNFLLISVLITMMLMLIINEKYMSNRVFKNLF